MNPKEQGKESSEIDFAKVEYLISDWDGTLTDSMPAYTKSFSTTLAEAFGIQKSSNYHRPEPLLHGVWVTLKKKKLKAG
ncbi:MAG: hypothetical protein ACOYT7_01405 [Patescibacteria group bacterium]